MSLEERKNKVAVILARRVQQVFPDQASVVARLAAEEKQTIYLGIDPSGPDLHLGHTVPLLLLKDLIELGHDVVLLVGDFTARIGDPSGKDTTRAVLTREQVEQNMASYLDQAHKIIPEGSFRVAYNSEWLSALTLEQILKLTTLVTVQQMIQRDMFQNRLKASKPIYLNEFLYPLMQGYDSVALRTDGEIGGNDQTFNMLVGRDLEKELLGKDKFVIALKLIVDPATGKKMSKTEGNFIALNDSPQEIRRKVLDLDDRASKAFFELGTSKDQVWIDNFSGDPRQFKEELAAELIRMYHGAQAVAQAAQATEIQATGPLVKVLETAGLAASSAAAKRLVEQGGVMVNGLVAARWDLEIKSGDQLQVGKGKFFKVS